MRFFFLNKIHSKYTHTYIEKMGEFRNEEYDQLIKPIMITGKIISIWPLAENSSRITITFRRFHLFCMFFLVSFIFDRLQFRMYSINKILQKFLWTPFWQIFLFSEHCLHFFDQLSINFIFKRTSTKSCIPTVGNRWKFSGDRDVCRSNSRRGSQYRRSGRSDRMRVNLHSFLPLRRSFARVFVPPEGHALRGEHYERGLALILGPGSPHLRRENDVRFPPREIFYHHRRNNHRDVHVRPNFGGKSNRFFFFLSFEIDEKKKNR